MPEPCGCSSTDEDDGYGVVCAEHAPYPPAEVWAAARVIVAADPLHADESLDEMEDEVRAHFYCVAEEASLAAKAVRDANTGDTDHG